MKKKRKIRPRHPRDKNESTSMISSTSTTTNSEESSTAVSDVTRNNDRPDTTIPRWISAFAIFGDSSWALGLSFVLLLISIGVSFWVESSREAKLADPYVKLGPVPNIDPPHIFYVDGNVGSEMLTTKDIQKAYEKDGVVAVRGLIDDELLKRLDSESAVLVDEQLAKNEGKNRGMGTQFFTTSHGVIFRKPEELGHDEASGVNVSGFVELALFSNVPRFAAELFGLVEKQKENGGNETLRMLRDIFLAKDTDQYICGWHVDDLGFWPATPESGGVNAWIALDDMPVERGGGFALAVGSDEASWRDEAYYVTGASTNFPPGGYKNASDMIERRTGSGTCNLKQSAPHLHRRMEETKRIYPIERGDVIFHRRWLFHRTVPFDKDFLLSRDDNDEPIYRRLSVRYAPGTAIIPPGYGTELSVLWDEANGGRTADDVCRLDGPWYPRVWPKASMEELLSEGFASLVDSKVPIAVERRIDRQKKMRPLLRKLAKQQNKPAL